MKFIVNYVVKPSEEDIAGSGCNGGAFEEQFLVFEGL